MSTTPDAPTSPTIEQQCSASALSNITPIPIPLAVIDANGNIIDANLALGALCDRDVDELRAMNLQTLIWGQDFDRYRDWLGEALENSGPRHSQRMCLRLADNSQRLVQLHATSWQGDPLMTQLIVHVEDIHERAHAEATLQYQSDMNKLLMNLSSHYETVTLEEVDRWLVEALCTIGTFIGADRSYMFSVSPDETEISNTHEWCAPGIEPQQENLQDIPMEAFAWWMETLRRNETINIPRVVDLGEEATDERDELIEQGVRSLLVLPLIAGGRLVGFTGFDAVREERTWPEEAILLLRASNSLFTSALVRRLMDSLQESEERYRTVVEDVRSVIFRIDENGNWSFLNKAWEELSGYTIEESLGKRAVDFIHPDDHERITGAITEIVSGVNDVGRTEVRAVVHDEVRWVEILGRSLRDSDGNVVGYSGSIDDITERKLAEQAADEARKEAERSSQAKSEFLSRMSHELRTPLNAILGFSQLMEMSDLGAEEAENVSHISRAGEHLLDLINEVLDIVRIEAGQMSLSLEPVELGALIGESLDLIRPASGELNLRIQTSLGIHHELWVQADRRRLKQVLVNLCGNAVKYNCEGGDITITCSRLANGVIRIDVTDTGIGIPQDRIDDVFVPFERLGAERTPIEGTGVGLTVTKSLVEAMGGSISVASRQREGSCFTVELPAATNQTSHSLVELPPSNRTAPVNGKNLALVLYIEDNPSNATLVRRILAYRPQIGLLVATEGMEGVELARMQRPDLILLDLHLPDMDGAEVLRLLLAEPDTKGVPVVMISADATEGQAKRLMAMGANDYLTKPIDVTQFLTTVDHYLKNRSKGKRAS